MALTARERLVLGYMRSIYSDGTRSFTGHNGTPPIAASYHTDVKVCAAGKLTVAEIDNALSLNRILDTEFSETCGFIGTPEANAWKTK